MITSMKYSAERYNACSHTITFDPDEVYAARDFARDVWAHIEQNADEQWFREAINKATDNRLPKEALTERLLEVNRLFHDMSFPVELQIVGHCNMQCKGCLVAAPVAKPWFADVDQLNETLSVYANLCGDIQPSTICVLGGEPTLHPRLLDVLWTVRKQFPTPATCMQMVTNGLVLRNMDDDTLKELMDIEIYLSVSVYGPATWFTTMQVDLNQPDREPPTCVGCSLHWPVIVSNYVTTDQSFITMKPDGDMFFCDRAYMYSVVRGLLDENAPQLRRGVDGDVINVHDVNNADELLRFMNRDRCPFSALCTHKLLEYRWCTGKGELKDYVVDKEEA